MNSRPLLCLFAASALLAASCGGGSSSTSNGVQKPPIFQNRDLQGDWVGSMAEDFGVETVAYLRCAANGYPYAGADGLGRDWLSEIPFSYAVVKPDGDVFLSYVVDREVFYLEGTMSRAGTLSGQYWTLYNGVLKEEGSFSFLRSAGAGSFTVVDHLAGSWTGSQQNQSGDLETVTLMLGPDGSILAGDRAGSVIDLNLSSSVLVFEDTNLGRIAPFDLVFTDGTTVQVHYALVSDDSSALEGPATDSVNGEVRLVFERG